jgi:hypothetical protein
MNIRPRPNLIEIEFIVHAYCELQWGVLHERYRSTAMHPYTTTEQLPFRCFEGVYVLTLLKDTFLFNSFSRQIMFASEVI